jgi:hypothetical protein
VGALSRYKEVEAVVDDYLAYQNYKIQVNHDNSFTNFPMITPLPSKLALQQLVLPLSSLYRLVHTPPPEL